MSKGKTTNVVKMKKSFQFNIGILIFALILIYTLYFVIQYFTTDHVTAYEVEEGSIVADNSYTGLALRQEQIYYTDNSGTINYFSPEGEKVGCHSLIYSIDSTGQLSSLLSDSSGDTSFINSDNLSDFKQLFCEFTNAYSDESFYSVYDLKDTTNSRLAEDKNLNALSELTASEDTDAINSLDLTYAAQPGVLLYSTDGYESVTPDTVNDYLFSESSYQNTTIENGSDVANGAVAYKLVTSETWDIVIPVSDDMAATLEDLGVVEVTFTEDNTSAWATVTILHNNDSTYAQLTFKNSMIRFAKERFVDIQLILDSVSGLKIPNSAITSKDFYLIPKEYLTTGGDSNSNGFLKQTTDKDGNTSTTFVSASLYYANDTNYYISEDDLNAGDIIVKPDSQECYTLTDTASLQGVYNINKGYAVFKQIEILYQNEDYSIVKKGTEYGLAQFDYIALTSSIIHEGQIIQ